MTEEYVIKKLETIKVSGDKDYIYNFEAGTILNLIQKQQEEIERLKNLNNHQSKDIQKAVDYTFELNKEIEQKDNRVKSIINRLGNDIKNTTETKAKKNEGYNYLDNYTRCRLKAYKTKTKEIRDYIKEQYFES